MSDGITPEEVYLETWNYAQHAEEVAWHRLRKPPPRALLGGVLFIGLCVFGRPEKGLNPQRSLSLEKGEKQGGKGETQGTSTSSARDSLLKKA